MLLRIVFFLGIFFCVSQDDLNNIVKYDSSDIEKSISFEINNIGDPVLLLMPKFVSSDYLLYHSSQLVRNVDFSKNIIQNRDTSIVSRVYYSNCYNEGGFLQSFVTRPIGKTSLFKFHYNNLSSKGFYANQQNKFSNLSLYFDFISDKYPYSNSVFFNSVNADYQLNGGLIDFSTDVSSDLLDTYLGFAIANVRKREFTFLQDYLFSEDLKIKHKLYMLKFQRNYTDSNPFSYHYYLTPLFPLILDYNLNTFFSTIDNKFSIIKNDLEFSVNHIFYNTNDLNKNNGDVFLSVKDNPMSYKKIKFNLSYCPIGYNKNNYVVNIDFNKIINNSTHYFSLDFVSKKPNFFIKHYNNGMLWNWSDFLSINQISLKTKSIMHQNNVSALLYFNRSVNYFYFNDLAHPVQLLDPLNYIKLQINKEFKLQSLSFNSLVCLQYSNHDALSVPLFLLNQEMVYKKSFIKDINISAKLSAILFSTYYPDAFFPLTDVFYQQRTIENKVVPFFTGNINISKNKFSIGVIFDHLSSFFFNNNFYVPMYTLPQPVMRFSLNWGFVD